MLMLILGLVSLLGSAFYASYVAAFIGLGLAFWGALLLFLRPTKHVRLELLTATASSSLMNTERLLASNGSKARGVYLPPKLLHDYQSSLVYVPAQEGEPLPKREEIPEQNPQPPLQALIILRPWAWACQDYSRSTWENLSPRPLQSSCKNCFPDCSTSWR